jgi:hypothetical protein
MRNDAFLGEKAKASEGIKIPPGGFIQEPSGNSFSCSPPEDWRLGDTGNHGTMGRYDWKILFQKLNVKKKTKRRCLEA